MDNPSSPRIEGTERMPLQQFTRQAVRRFRLVFPADSRQEIIDILSRHDAAVDETVHKFFNLHGHPTVPVGTTVAVRFSQWTVASYSANISETPIGCLFVADDLVGQFVRIPREENLGVLSADIARFGGTESGLVKILAGQRQQPYKVVG